MIARKTYVWCLLLGTSALGADRAAGALISHFTFNGNTNNSVLGAPDGTAIGGPTFITGYDGTPNGAISFAAGINQYVDTTANGRPNATDGGILVGTVANWIRTTSTGFVEVMGIANPVGMINDQGGFLWEGNRSANQLRLFNRSANNQSTTLAVTTPNWRDGQWHHIAVAWDFTGGLTSVGEIYLDGQPLGATLSTLAMSSSSTLTPWTTPLIVGARNNRGSIVEANVAFDLDDLRIYDHMLSQSEIAALVPEPSSIVLLFSSGIIVLVALFPTTLKPRC